MLAFVHEDLMDLGILVFVFDLRAAFFDVLAGVLELFDIELEPPRFERQIARRLRSWIEMLMPPLHGRDEHAHAPPLDPLLGAVFAFRPEEGIAGTGQHNDMGTRAVAVRSEER